MTQLGFAFLAAVLCAPLTLASGCGDDTDDLYGPGVGPTGESVGGACRSHGDCVDVCIIDDNYPGMCSFRCAHDVDCPMGSVCIEDNNGMCAIACGSHIDCEPMGRGWLCDDRDRNGADGAAFVCRVQ